jgi:chemotaxis protein MotA
MATTATALKETPRMQESARRQIDASRIDSSMLAGIAIALAATVAGIVSTRLSPSYFLQPTGALIVLGGTLGVMFITTPRLALAHSASRVANLLWIREVDRAALIEEILGFIKTSRTLGLPAIDPMIPRATSAFLRESLEMAAVVAQRSELQATLETKIRLRERQCESDAKTLEVAGGFAPTIGVLGTVIGMIDVLRQFSNVAAVAGGMATAFVSTIYGLALANLVLLPAANRIRARAAEEFEIHEMVAEGVLCLFDRTHPALVRDRLNCFLRESK